MKLTVLEVRVRQ